jgi:hypothetical protein
VHTRRFATVYDVEVSKIKGIKNVTISIELLCNVQVSCDSHLIQRSTVLRGASETAVYS